MASAGRLEAGMQATSGRGRLRPQTVVIATHAANNARTRRGGFRGRLIPIRTFVEWADADERCTDKGFGEKCRISKIKKSKFVHSHYEPRCQI